MTWKGTKEKIVPLTTANDGAACGFTFEFGKSYLVYAYLGGLETDEKRLLETNICTRTCPFEAEAKEEIKLLGKPKMPPT
jgi:hypothetical protein